VAACFETTLIVNSAEFRIFDLQMSIMLDGRNHGGDRRSRGMEPGSAVSPRRRDGSDLQLKRRPQISTLRCAPSARRRRGQGGDFWRGGADLGFFQKIWPSRRCSKCCHVGVVCSIAIKFGQRALYLQGSIWKKLHVKITNHDTKTWCVKS
jgi:hypothetical protein